MSGILSPIPLGELQEIIAIITEVIRTGSFADKIQAMNDYREKAEMYNYTFNLLNGGKVRGNPGYTDIYEKEYRG